MTLSYFETGVQLTDLKYSGSYLDGNDKPFINATMSLRGFCVILHEVLEKFA